MAKHLIYLHGFLSSPESTKAQETAEWMAQQGLSEYFHAPFLRPYPADACTTIARLAESLPGPVCFIGSSLGGFLATWAAERYGAAAVLINPAAHPQFLLKYNLGVQHNLYRNEIYVMQERHAQECAELDIPLQKGRYWLLAQKGDTTLDYRHAAAKYAGHRQTIEEGGEHDFQGYTRWLPEIADFLALGR